MTNLRGKDFIALRRLSTADDATLAEVGETCERVPVKSLPPLLASGKIAPVKATTHGRDDAAAFRPHKMNDARRDAGSNDAAEGEVV